MSPFVIHAYAARAAGQQLEPADYEPPKLGESDVRIAVTHCGVCHTDIQGIDDYYEITSYPFVPGHEIVGNVYAAGRHVSGLKEGDRVGVGWQGRSCGHCEWCLKGQEQFCMDIVDCATWTPVGGFSSSVVVDHRFAHLLPGAMPSEQAAVLMCAGISVYAPLHLLAGLPPQNIAILGIGGLGHLAIQFAHAFGHEVTAISSCADKQAEALALGADHFMLSGEQYFRQAQYRFDLLLCTATGKLDWNHIMWILKKNGRILLLGFPDVQLNSTDLVAHQLSITTSFLGNRAAFRDMLDFSQAHAIRASLELMPMSEVNAALQRVRDNKARYRIVLVN